MLNCPLFVNEYLEIEHCKKVIVDDNVYAPSGHCVLTVTRCAKSDVQKAHDKVILNRLQQCNNDNNNNNNNITNDNDKEKK